MQSAATRVFGLDLMLLTRPRCGISARTASLPTWSRTATTPNGQPRLPHLAGRGVRRAHEARLTARTGVRDRPALAAARERRTWHRRAREIHPPRSKACSGGFRPAASTSSSWITRPSASSCAATRPKNPAGSSCRPCGNGHHWTRWRTSRVGDRRHGRGQPADVRPVRPRLNRRPGV
jgi:hypothetical protein